MKKSLVVSKIVCIFASEKIEETDEEIIIAGSSSFQGRLVIACMFRIMVAKASIARGLGSSVNQVAFSFSPEENSM